MKYFLAIIIIITLSIPVLLFANTKADAISLILSKDELGPNGAVMVLIPHMTTAAYSENGFYAYYSNSCDSSCLTVDVYQTNKLGEAGSQNTWRTLKRVGYAGMSDYIMDYYLRSDPDFMQKYDTMIVLHSEYVTQRLYDALQKHPHVIYLAPNTNYGLVQLDKYHMTLLSGHGFNGKNNAFDWKYDNTDREYDKECKDWKFVQIGNGYQLNCNPELILQKKTEILKTLRII